MAEVQQRPSGPRGRGSGRGGRGGYSSRGGRQRQANGDKTEATVNVTYEDEGEIGQLKKKYASNLAKIKEMFPDWTDDDIVFALEENSNDVERTVERMSEGTIVMTSTKAFFDTVCLLMVYKAMSRSGVK